LRVGVWDRVGKVDRFVLFLEVVLELQLAGFPVESISAYPLGTDDIKTVTLIPFIIDEDIGFHSLGIEVLFLAEVADVELNLSKLIFIVNLEVKPGSVSPGIGVTPEEEIILYFFDSDCHVEVSCLESRIEMNLISIRIRDHSFPIFTYPLDGLLDHVQ